MAALVVPVLLLDSVASPKTGKANSTSDNKSIVTNFFIVALHSWKYSDRTER